MRCRVKLLFIILIVFFVSGCSANYNVEIYNETVKVNGKILEKDKNKWDEPISIDSPPLSIDDKDIPQEYKDLTIKNEVLTYKQLVDRQLKPDDLVKPLEGLSSINTPWQLGLKFKRRYNLYGDTVKSFIMVAGADLCYDKFNIIEDEDNNNIIISTSNQNKCFDMYPNLDKITVKLKTNHKVVDSTADSVDLHTYTWDLTRDNSKDKPLQITLKRNEYVFNYDNRIVKIVGFSALIAFIIVIFYKIGIIIYNFKIRRRNRI